MKLYRAKIPCSYCGKPIIGKPYSRDDSELLARIDHRDEFSHFADGFLEALIEVEAVESDPPKRRK